MLVPKTVDKASKNPNHAFIPKFEALETDELRSIASCLIGVNVETKKGKETFMKDKTLSVSMSPAVAIVLANLLNAEAISARGWQKFESTITLCEWKWMVAHSTTIPSSVNRTILELRAPVPMKRHQGTKRGFDINVPVVNRFTVVLNGPRAPYADVIAPFRLVQAKFSEKVDDQPKDLDLLHELGKMGLTTNSEWRLQQALTSVFHTMWESEEEVASATEDRLDCSPDVMNAYYPYSSLLVRWIHEKHPEINLNFVIRSDSVTMIEQEERQVKVLKDLDPPITAVFATNCKEFVLEGSKIHIGPSDVDWEGNLTPEKKLPPHVLRCLRKNVLIRFIFC